MVVTVLPRPSEPTVLRTTRTVEAQTGSHCARATRRRIGDTRSPGRRGCIQITTDLCITVSGEFVETSQSDWGEYVEGARSELCAFSRQPVIGRAPSMPHVEQRPKVFLTSRLLTEDRIGFVKKNGDFLAVYLYASTATDTFPLKMGLFTSSSATSGALHFQRRAPATKPQAVEKFRKQEWRACEQSKG